MKKGFKSAWSSLKNSKTGMFGLILVLLIIICAIFAPLLAPYDPLAQDVMIKLKDPIWALTLWPAICWALTNWAATFSPVCCTAPASP